MIEQGSAALLEAAVETARGMRSVVEGKAVDCVMHSDARSFAGIARVLELLVGEVERHQRLARTRGDALTRIAEFKIRGGARLVEAGRWQKIAAELREIAGETLATGPLAGISIPPPVEPVGSGRRCGS